MTPETLARIRPLADAILKLLGVSVAFGSIVVHYADGNVQRVETHEVHRPVIVKRIGE